MTLCIRMLISCLLLDQMSFQMVWQMVSCYVFWRIKCISFTTLEENCNHIMVWYLSVFPSVCSQVFCHSIECNTSLTVSDKMTLWIAQDMFCVFIWMCINIALSPFYILHTHFFNEKGYVMLLLLFRFWKTLLLTWFNSCNIIHVITMCLTSVTLI